MAELPPHPYNEWCICERCSGIALMLLPDCHAIERRYLNRQRPETEQTDDHAHRQPHPTRAEIT